MPLRLRQIALATPDLDASTLTVQMLLGLAHPHRDPSVGLFGLRNSVFTLGDGFLELVSPTQAGTTVGRLLEKQQDTCGYMVIFQVADLSPLRARVHEQGVRVVWEIAFDATETIHLHPKDMGAVVSFDKMPSWDTWLWAGPQQPPAQGDGLPLREVTLAVERPEVSCARWAAILGSEAQVDAGVCRVTVGATAIQFVEGNGERESGLVSATLGVPALWQPGLPLAEGEFQLGRFQFRFEAP